MINYSNVHGPGHTREEYLAALNAGHETGYWDEHGHPAPWPDDIEEWTPPDKINIDPEQPTNF